MLLAGAWLKHAVAGEKSPPAGPGCPEGCVALGLVVGRDPGRGGATGRAGVHGWAAP